MSDRLFTLNVRMENAEMQSGDALADALEAVVYQLRSLGPESPVGYSRVIHDANGNTVGEWRGRKKISPEKEAKEIVKGVFTFLDGAKFRDADVEEQSAVFIAEVIADTIRTERGRVR